MKVPKRIWFLWFQGYKEAPHLVKKCWQSWKKHNPEWNIVFLDENNLSIYTDIDLKDPQISRLGKAQQSDLVRLHLLSTYGGCWVDSTCFCTKPLDEWLDDCTKSGFFAFSNPGRDRLISNWFLVSEQGNIITSKLYKQLSAYFTENEYRNVNRTRNMRLLKKILCRTTKTTKFWFNPLFTKVLKFFPYYCFHYLFTELVHRDRKCRQVWQMMPKLGADSCHSVLKQMHSPLTQDFKQAIDKSLVPVYKLSYKKYGCESSENDNTNQSVVQYLLQSV